MPIAKQSVDWVVQNAASNIASTAATSTVGKVHKGVRAKVEQRKQRKNRK